MGEIKVAKHVVKGMTQDLAKSKFLQDMSFENWNIRLVATDNQSTYSIINEKGNKKINDISIEGTIIGHCVINNYIILFTTGSKDRIYKLSVNDSLSIPIISTLLFEGYLNFNSNNSIDTIGWYENDKIINVYWIDGVNQIRVINIMNDYIGYPNTVFDFLLETTLPQINITKNFIKDSANQLGLFPSGTVQYAYNLYYKNGQETNISPISPIWYISTELVNGEKVNENCLTSFTLDIDLFDNFLKNKFYGIKIYKFQRTTLDEVPKITCIYDQKITSNHITVTDDGNLFVNELNPTLVDMLGSTFIIPNTFEHKNNRLFVANYKTKSIFIDNNLATRLRQNIDWTLKCNSYAIDAYSTKPVKSELFYQGSPSECWKYNENDNSRDCTYYYKNFKQEWLNILSNKGIKTYKDYLDSNKSLTSFKRREKYRFAVELCDKYSNWTNAIYLSDILFDNETCKKYNVEYKPFTTDSTIISNYAIIFANHIFPRFHINNSFKLELINNGFTGWRIVMVERNESNSTILSQGVLSGTLFNTSDRKKGIWAMPDYLTRNLAWNQYLPKSNRVLSYVPVEKPSAVVGQLGFFDRLSGTSTLKLYPGSYAQTIGREWAENSKYISNIPSNDKWGGWVDKTGGWIFDHPDDNPSDDSHIYSDSNVLNFYSPEITIFGKDELSLSGVSINICGWQLCSWASTVLNYKYKDSTLNLTRYGKDDRLVLYDGYINSHPSGTVLPNSLGNMMVTPRQQLTDNDIKIDEVLKHRSFLKYFGTSDYLETPYMLVDSLVDKKYTNPDGGLTELVVNDTSSDSLITYNNEIDTTYQLSDDSSKIITLRGKDAKNIVFALPEFKGGSFLNKNFRFALLPQNTSIWATENLTTSFYRSVFDREPNNQSAILLSNAITKPSIYITELVRNLNNQYGEIDSMQTEYIPCSDALILHQYYQNYIDVTQGDVFLQRFDMLKSFVKSPTDYQTIASNISILLETSTNLDKRFDKKRYDKDNMYSQPETYYGYNKVYDQSNNFRKSFILDSKIDEVTNFPNNIITTDVKYNGSLVDNWTHFLPNETLQVEGSYGGITKLVNINSYMYAIQDSAISYLMIQPRVQVNASDGVPIELGTGLLFESYKYIDILQGTKNKWGITKANNTFYFIDENNKSINVLTENGIESLSVKKGLTSLITLMSNDSSKLDNNNFSSFYDKNNNEVYFTFRDKNKLKSTLTFSEVTNEFASRYSYTPRGFIRIKDRLFTYLNEHNGLWEQFAGYYNTFYNKKYESSVTYLVNQDVNLDKTFNNLEWESEFYSGINYDIDEYDKTWNKLKVWNEYQSTGDTRLILNKNLKRRFRIWRSTIPRMSNKGVSLNRIRNNWTFIKLSYVPIDAISNDITDNEKTFWKSLTNKYYCQQTNNINGIPQKPDNNYSNIDYKTILHDLLVYYTI